jgi:two-component system, NarL family, nitrate/nitrite response regulator NarL
MDAQTGFARDAKNLSGEALEDCLSNRLKAAVRRYRALRWSKGFVTPREYKSEALKLVIVSEVRFVRESLSDILSRGGAIMVVGQYAEPSEARRGCQELRPDMVLLDAALQGGRSTVRSLRETIAGPSVVVFALSESVEAVLDWAEAGVAGYIPSTASSNDLQTLITKIDGGQQDCSALVAGALLHSIANSTGPPDHPTASTAPTPRELEIIRLIDTGLSNKEIARRLNIGLATTKSHVHNTLVKLNLQRRGQIAAYMRGRMRLD